MKKIFMALALLFSTSLVAHSQTTTSSKKHKKAKTATTAKAKTTGARLKKDGTPDKRFKANKEKKVATSKPGETMTPRVSKKKKKAQASAEVTQPRASEVTQTKAPRVTQTRSRATQSAGKVIGTDSKGRTIYEGPRGGKYYINKNGNKEYVK